MIQRVENAFVARAGMRLDFDGAPRAYAPVNPVKLADGTLIHLQPLDALGNAGRPGDWWGLVVDPDGEPILQGPDDPAPYYGVSTTALQDRSRPIRDPRRYVDASTMPYIVIPPEVKQAGGQLGDVGIAVYGPLVSAYVVADIGPKGKFGEGSPALAEALGIDSRRKGGVDDGVFYCIFTESSQGWPREFTDVMTQALGLFAKWGDLDRLAQVLSQ